jgi:signal transduction histidine kinase
MDNLVDQIIDSVRALSRRRLREAEINAESLYTHIGICVRSFAQRTRIRTHFSKTGNDNDLSKPICAAILDILKEALTNVIRHARATEVHVDAVCHQRFLALSICDNGTGARKCALHDAAGVGLNSIERRVKALAGTVDFRSIAGHGFELFVRIPKNVHMLASDFRRMARGIKERAQTIVK